MGIKVIRVMAFILVFLAVIAARYCMEDWWVKSRIEKYHKENGGQLGE